MALTTGGHLSASGKYLASFVEHYETDDCDFRRVLTLRKFSGCPSSVATIVDQILDRDTLLPDAVNNVAKIYLDDAYVIVEYRRNRRLDIRSIVFGEAKNQGGVAARCTYPIRAKPDRAAQPPCLHENPSR